MNKIKYLFVFQIISSFNIAYADVYPQAVDVTCNAIVKVWDKQSTEDYYRVYLYAPTGGDENDKIPFYVSIEHVEGLVFHGGGEVVLSLYEKEFFNDTLLTRKTISMPYPGKNSIKGYRLWANPFLKERRDAEVYLKVDYIYNLGDNIAGKECKTPIVNIQKNNLLFDSSAIFGPSILAENSSVQFFSKIIWDDGTEVTDEPSSTPTGNETPNDDVNNRFIWKIDFPHRITSNNGYIETKDVSNTENVELKYIFIFSGESYSKSRYLTIVDEPNILIGNPTNITDSSVKFSGSVNPKGLSAKTHFEWGEINNGNYFSSSSRVFNIAAINSYKEISYSTFDVECGSYYRVRMVAESDAGKETSHEVAFKTSECPPKKILNSPELNVTVNNRTVTAKWNKVENSDGSFLSYAKEPYAGSSSIQSIDMGTNTNISVDLSEGDEYYVAVNAYNQDGFSQFSNIEKFKIEKQPEAPSNPYAYTHWAGTSKGSGYINGKLESCEWRHEVYFINETIGEVYSQLEKDNSTAVHCASGSANFQYSVEQGKVIIDILSVEGSSILENVTHFELAVDQNNLNHIYRNQDSIIFGYNVNNTSNYYLSN